MLTVLLAAAAAWTVASLVVAGAFCLLSRGARRSDAREADHLSGVRPAEPVEPAEPHLMPASFAPVRPADDLVGLPSRP